MEDIQQHIYAKVTHIQRYDKRCFCKDFNFIECPSERATIFIIFYRCHFFNWVILRRCGYTWHFSLNISRTTKKNGKMFKLNLAQLNNRAVRVHNKSCETFSERRGGAGCINIETKQILVHDETKKKRRKGWA